MEVCSTSDNELHQFSGRDAINDPDRVQEQDVKRNINRINEETDALFCTIVLLESFFRVCMPHEKKSPNKVRAFI